MTTTTDGDREGDQDHGAGEDNRNIDHVSCYKKITKNNNNNKTNNIYYNYNHDYHHSLHRW